MNGLIDQYANSSKTRDILQGERTRHSVSQLLEGRQNGAERKSKASLDRGDAECFRRSIRAPCDHVEYADRGAFR